VHKIFCAATWPHHIVASTIVEARYYAVRRCSNCLDADHIMASVSYSCAHAQQGVKQSVYLSVSVSGHKNRHISRSRHQSDS
jgi:hypothetical protein